MFLSFLTQAQLGKKCFLSGRPGQSELGRSRRRKELILPVFWRKLEKFIDYIVHGSLKLDLTVQLSLYFPFFLWITAFPLGIACMMPASSVQTLQCMAQAFSTQVLKDCGLWQSCGVFPMTLPEGPLGRMQGHSAWDQSIAAEFEWSMLSLNSGMRPVK